MKLSIIIPVYNEEKTILEILEKAKKVDIGDIKKEIIIIDDCSKDNSWSIIQNIKDKDIKKLRHNKNKGKGGAIKTALEHATGDFIIFQDADLEYDPKDYPKLLKPLIEKKCDIVFGSRFVNQKFILFGKNKPAYLPVHFYGNKLLILYFNLLYNTRLSDVEPCYKLFKSNILKSINVKSDGFEYDIELMCKLIKKGYKIVQLPIKYYPRSFKEGKKINWRDGIKAGYYMLKCRFLN